MSDSPKLAPTINTPASPCVSFPLAGRGGRSRALSAGRRGGANTPRDRHGESRGARSDAGLARKAGDAGRGRGEARGEQRLVRQPLAKDPEGCRGYHQVHRGGAQEERAEVRGCGGRDQDYGGGGGRRSAEPARRAQVPQDPPRGESAWSAASVFSRHPPSLSAHRGEASNARVSRGFDALRSPSPPPHPICPPSLLHRRLLPDPPPPRVIAPRVYDSSRLTPLPPLPDVAGRRRGCPRARAGEARRVFQRDPGCRGGARRRRRRVVAPPPTSPVARRFLVPLSSSRGPISPPRRRLCASARRR